MSATPVEPTCRQITVSVSAQASMIGVHQSEKIGSIPMRCGISGNVTAVKPRAALRRISRAPSSASARYVMPIGTMRSACGEYHSSKNQSFHARVTASPRSASPQRENTEPQKPVICDGKFTDAHTPLMSMSRTRAFTSKHAGRISSKRVGSTNQSSVLRPTTAFKPTWKKIFPSNCHTS